MFLIRYVKYIIPFGIIELLRRRYKECERVTPMPPRDTTRDGSLLLRDGYYSDLTTLERWGLLAAVLDLEKRMDSVRYLEIGAFGGGTIKFLKENTHRVRFTGIDLFEDFQPHDANTHISPTFRFEDVQKALGNSVELIKGDSTQVLSELSWLKHSYDIIFIDANHTYNATRSDFEHSIPLLKDGGYIAFHNSSVGIYPDNKYVVQDGGPWRVTQEIRRLPNFHLEIEVERLRVFSYEHTAGDSPVIRSRGQ